MPRIGKACSRCKSRKLKCDGLRPCCSRCQKLGHSKCEYLPDKRVDKRQRMNGKHVFVFKHADTGHEDLSRSLKNPYVQHVTPPAIEFGTLMDSDASRVSSVGSSETLPQFNVPADFPEASETWPELIPDLFSMDMEFNTDEFLCLLDEAIPVDSHFELTDANLHPHHQVLIDAVFGNKRHTPPAVSYEMVREIDSSSSKTNDEEFLHATILAIGALTLAKRDLVSQHQNTTVRFAEDAESVPLELKLPSMASEAFDHYTRAKQLIPYVLENPSRHGFRGLALMANFMSILLTPETQMFITYHALQIAVAIGLTSTTSVEHGTDEYGLLVAFWGLWSSSCMLSTFHGRPPPLSRERISATAQIKMPVKFVEKFFSIRIRFAELTGLVTRVIGSSEKNGFFPILQAELSLLCNEVNMFEEMFIEDVSTYNRHELLALELKCWKGYVSMLLNLPALLESRHNRAVVVAKHVIKDLWAYYFSYKQKCLPHLDWNFSYPLRNTTLCVWIACMILTKAIVSSSYLTFDCIELKLGTELLSDLTSIIPINKYLLKDLEAMKHNESSCSRWLF